MAEADALQFDIADRAAPPARAGVKLREARERAGIGRAELSLRTKISERHLEAVEDSDFAALPARIYAVGFARSYAAAVGLDAAAIAAEVRRELTDQENPAAPRPSHQLDIEDPTKIPSRRLAWLTGLLALVLVAVGALVWRSYFAPAVDLPPVTADAGIADPGLTPPELSPSAQISPTAESALGQPGAVQTATSAAPLSVPAATPAARRSAARPPAASPPRPPQSTPSPIPDTLRPAPELDIAPAAKAASAGPG